MPSAWDALTCRTVITVIFLERIRVAIERSIQTELDQMRSPWYSTVLSIAQVDAKLGFQ